ncbi:hypothetical protein Enr8_32340 [Blastopirellula retiformator]|uniref:Uncharacterized protein n=1 Tax=Blastopirellula retiformator TaxID=2527970 RepID=A0A5C5V4C6_9BACT|nr:hypothetical protein Enr8_32340 [Blastopirellula retiformator]
MPGQIYTIVASKKSTQKKGVTPAVAIGLRGYCADCLGAEPKIEPSPSRAIR